MKKFKLLVILAVLGMFIVGVNAQGANNATLSWTPPTQNTDGTAYTDPAGFIVYRGSTATTYDQPNVTLTTAQVTCNTATPVVCTYGYNVPNGTWYWAISAVDTVGNIGAKSNQVSKTVTTEVPGACTNATVQ